MLHAKVLTLDTSRSRTGQIGSVFWLRVVSRDSTLYLGEETQQDVYRVPAGAKSVNRANSLPWLSEDQGLWGSVSGLSTLCLVT